MRKSFLNFLHFHVILILVFIPYVFFSLRISPLNEEEWLVGQKIFISGFDTETEELLVSSDFCSKFSFSDTNIKVFSGRITLLSPEVYLNFSKLPPIVSLCFFGNSIPILGWGHIGPISLIYYKILENLLKPNTIFLVRIPALLVIIFIGLLFAHRMKDGRTAAFLMSFPVSLFFISAANLFYSLLYIFSFLAFIHLLEGRFRLFCLFSSLAVLVHMRGLVIFVSFLVSYIIAVKSGVLKNKDERYVISSIICALVVLIVSLIYLLPSAGKFPSSESIYIVEVFSSFDIFEHFLENILRKLPIILQLLGTRIGDALNSTNIILIIKELGLLKRMPTHILFFSIVVSILFSVPAFLYAKNRLYLMFFFTYLIFSIFAVPFFGAMPWQFIPVNFLILIPSYRFLKEKRLELMPIFAGIAFMFFAGWKLEHFISDYALWKNHKELMDFISAHGKEDKKFITITKSNIIQLIRNHVEAKYFVQISEERNHTLYKEYLLKILPGYDIILLSYHFFHLENLIPTSHRKIFANKIFRLFMADENLGHLNSSFHNFKKMKENS